MSDALLPPDFADLEPFAREWALPTMSERYNRRHASNMAEMQAFYDAAVPRGEAAIDYVNQFPLDDMPDDAMRLMWLMAALSAVSFAVDIFRHPRIPSAGTADLPIVKEMLP